MTLLKNIGLTHTLRILDILLYETLRVGGADASEGVFSTKRCALAEAFRREGGMPPARYANDKLTFLTTFA